MLSAAEASLPTERNTLENYADFSPTMICSMKIHLDGSSIASIDDFYNQIEKYLTAGECPWGRNLDSLDEIVLYSFNYTDNPSLNVTEIIWSDSAASEQNLKQGERQNLFDVLVETLSSNEDIKLILS